MPDSRAVFERLLVFFQYSNTYAWNDSLLLRHAAAAWKILLGSPFHILGSGLWANCKLFAHYAVRESFESYSTQPLISVVKVCTRVNL